MQWKRMTRAVPVVLVLAMPLGAQETRDEEGVRAAVAQLFDGMRAADSAAVRAVFAPAARFAVLNASGIAAQSVDGFVSAIAGSERRWNEQIYDVEVRVEEAMASVWAPYTFYLDGAVRHCGTNSIELLRDAEGWKITQVSDTRRTEGCPDPLGGGR